MESLRLKEIETIHKHCTIHDKIDSDIGKINISETAIHVIAFE